MKITAVIFDMDGVIVDSELLNEQHHIEFLQKLGLVHSSTKSLRGLSSKSIWSELKEAHGLQDEVEVLIRKARESYLNFLSALPEISIVPGVKELITQLEKAGYKLALASSANPKRIELFLDQLKLAHHFSVIVSADDVEHSKPNPEIFLLAAKRLGIKPKNCMVIEDAAAGVAAAKAAGMTCLGFMGLEDNTEDLSKADGIIKDFSKITNTVKKGHDLYELKDSGTFS